MKNFKRFLRTMFRLSRKSGGKKGIDETEEYIKQMSEEYIKKISSEVNDNISDKITSSMIKIKRKILDDIYNKIIKRGIVTNSLVLLLTLSSSGYFGYRVSNRFAQAKIERIEKTYISRI